MLLCSNNWMFSSGILNVGGSASNHAFTEGHFFLLLLAIFHCWIFWQLPNILLVQELTLINHSKVCWKRFIIEFYGSFQSCFPHIPCQCIFIFNIFLFCGSGVITNLLPLIWIELELCVCVYVCVWFVLGFPWGHGVQCRVSVQQHRCVLSRRG